MEQLIVKIMQTKYGIGEQEVFDFISQVVKMYGLQDYVHEVLFLNNQSHSFTYSRSQKRITIDLPWLAKYLGLHESRFIKTDDIFNLFFIIIHEITHVFQCKKAKTDNDFEAQIYQLCDDFLGYEYMLFKKVHYNILHELYPIERMADIDALLTLTSVAIDRGIDYSGELQLLNETYARGYKFGKSPLELFLLTIHSDFLKRQDFYDRNRIIMIDNIASLYDPYTILRLGLPIKKEELKRIRERI